MPRIEGRMRKEPIIDESYMGRDFVLSINDAQDPEFWLTISFTPDEIMKLFEDYVKWLVQIGELTATPWPPFYSI